MTQSKRVFIPPCAVGAIVVSILPTDRLVDKTSLRIRQTVDPRLGSLVGGERIGSLGRIRTDLDRRPKVLRRYTSPAYRPGMERERAPGDAQVSFTMVCLETWRETCQLTQYTHM